MLEISKAEFLDSLQDGVRRTAAFIARLTEYHGGPVKTEYLLTADIARALLDRGYEVRVEKLNRELLNPLTARKGWVPKKNIGAERTDVAVTDADLIPRVLVEVKLGIGKTIYRIRSDLEKIANLMESLSAECAARLRAASVFQIHVPGCARDITVERLVRKVDRLEASLRNELSEFQQLWPGLTFSLVPLSGPNEGFVSTAIDVDEDGSKVIGESGHATRYYAVLVSYIEVEKCAASS